MQCNAATNDKELRPVLKHSPRDEVDLSSTGHTGLARRRNADRSSRFAGWCDRPAHGMRQK